MPAVVSTTFPIASAHRRLIVLAMVKRIAATVLWFYAGWYLGVTIAWALNMGPALGPIIGAAAAAMIAWDPRRFLWKPTTSDQRRSRPVSESA